MENKRLEVLRRRSDFQNLKTKGKRVRSNWLLLSFCKNDEDQSRCGWTISKKVGTAVVRNRYKRWCREFFRHNEMQSVDQNIDVNVVLLSKSKNKDFFKTMKHSDFEKELSSAWQKIPSVKMGK